MKLLPILLLAGASAAQATLYQYNYLGDLFDPELDLGDVSNIGDRITASFMMDDSLWGRSIFGDSPVQNSSFISDGLHTEQASANVITDSHGGVLQWVLFTFGPVWNLWTGLIDHHDYPNLIPEQSDHSESPSVTGARFVRYPTDPLENPHPPSPRWTYGPVASVPDTGSTALLLAFSCGLILMFKKR